MGTLYIVPCHRQRSWWHNACSSGVSVDANVQGKLVYQLGQAKELVFEGVMWWHNACSSGVSVDANVQGNLVYQIGQAKELVF